MKTINYKGYEIWGPSGWKDKGWIVENKKTGRALTTRFRTIEGAKLHINGLLKRRR